MVNDLLDRMPPALKSLWQLETELRTALQNAVMLRKDEAGQHFDAARRHLEEALASINSGNEAARSAPATSSEQSEPPGPVPSDQAKTNND